MTLFVPAPPYQPPRSAPQDLSFWTALISAGVGLLKSKSEKKKQKRELERQQAEAEAEEARARQAEALAAAKKAEAPAPQPQPAPQQGQPFYYNYGQPVYQPQPYRYYAPQAQPAPQYGYAYGPQAVQRQQLTRRDERSLKLQNFLHSINTKLAEYRPLLASAERSYQLAYSQGNAPLANQWATYYQQVASIISQLEQQKIQYS